MGQALWKPKKALINQEIVNHLHEVQAWCGFNEEEYEADRMNEVEQEVKHNGNWEMHKFDFGALLAATIHMPRRAFRCVCCIDGED
jgi:hypothetical protein